MFRSVVIAAFGIVLATATQSVAADNDGGQTYMAAAAATSPALAAGVDWSGPSMQFDSAQSRGALLPSLYVSLAALNAFDAYSTTKAVKAGIGSESNAVMQGLAHNSAAMWAAKGGTTAVSILLAERMWRNHRRVAAITTMIIMNGMMAAVAANNAKVIAR